MTLRLCASPDRSFLPWQSPAPRRWANRHRASNRRALPADPAWAIMTGAVQPRISNWRLRASGKLDHAAYAWNELGVLFDRVVLSAALPRMAVRMLQLGEETGELRSSTRPSFSAASDRVVGIVGSLAIILISTVVGGLIVSVMTALLSVSQVVG